MEKFFFSHCSLFTIVEIEDGGIDSGSADGRRLFVETLRRDAGLQGPLQAGTESFLTASIETVPSRHLRNRSVAERSDRLLVRRPVANAASEPRTRRRRCAHLTHFTYLSHSHTQWGWCWHSGWWSGACRLAGGAAGGRGAAKEEVRQGGLAWKAPDWRAPGRVITTAATGACGLVDAAATC